MSAPLSLESEIFLEKTLAQDLKQNVKKLTNATYPKHTKILATLSKEVNSILWIQRKLNNKVVKSKTIYTKSKELSDGAHMWIASAFRYIPNLQDLLLHEDDYLVRKHFIECIVKKRDDLIKNVLDTIFDLIGKVNYSIIEDLRCSLDRYIKQQHKIEDYAYEYNQKETDEMRRLQNIIKVLNSFGRPRN